MTGEQLDMLKTIRRLGMSGAHFQFRQLREALGVEPGEKNRTARLHNAFKALEGEGLIAEVAGSRKRNRYYRVANEERLKAHLGGSQQLLGVAVPSSPVVSPTTVPLSAPDRLSRIEGLLAAISERLERVEQRLDQLAGMWT